jgi:negative modulator of initiation of replication
MKTIEVEDDVYAYLLSQAQEIGEAATPILRRELGLKASGTLSAKLASPDRTPASRKLIAFVEDPMFSRHTTAKDCYLAILSFLATQHKDAFDKVLTINGRNRVYFARTRQEISQSGTSTEPREVPNTSFWAMTNSPTEQKRDTMRRVLAALGYDSSVVREVAGTIR